MVKSINNSANFLSANKISSLSSDDATASKFGDSLSAAHNSEKKGGGYNLGTQSTATAPYGGSTTPLQFGLQQVILGATKLVSNLPVGLSTLLTGRDAYRSDNAEPTIGQLVLAGLMVSADPKRSPPSLSPFIKDGQPMGIVNSSEGLTAQAWKTPSNQVIVAFSGTNPFGPYGTAWYKGVTDSAGPGVLEGRTTPAEQDALRFTREVQKEAAKQGIAPSKVYATGISLGATMASYVANQTGMPGLGMVSPGSPEASLKSRGENFLNIVATGDPFSMSDRRFGVNPSVVDNNLVKYGKTVIVGNPVNNKILTGLSSALLATKPASVDPKEYVLKSFLALPNLLLKQPGSLRYLRPIPLAYGLFTDLTHVAGTLPTLLTSTNKTPSQFLNSSAAIP